MNSSSTTQANGAARKSRFTNCFLFLLGAALALSAQGQTTTQRLVKVVSRLPEPTAAASAATNAETFRLAGKVVDEKGQPVAGAVLEAYAGERSLQQDDLELQQRLTTGADGRFELVLPRGFVEVIARKVGQAPTWWNAWYQSAGSNPDATNETLVLTAPTVLAGTVVDEADKPVADAEVRVSLAYLERELEDGGTRLANLHGQPARETFATRTTAEGKFRFENFPTNGSADLEVLKPGKVLREIVRPHRGPDTLFHPEDQDIKLVLDPGGSIEGKVVVEATGKPLAGAKLSLLQNQPGYPAVQNLVPATAGADGGFVLPSVAPGNYMLRASFGGKSVPEWVAEPVAVTVEVGKTARDLQVAAVPGGFLKAVVLGKEDMSFVNNASIRVNHGAYQTFGTTGTNGAVLFRLPPGTYQVFASRGTVRAEGTSLTIESGETNRHEFLLNPPPRLVGTVRDPAGQPARGLPVSIFGAYSPNITGVTTDEQGHFAIIGDAQRFAGMNNSTPCLVVRDLQHSLVAAQDLEPDGKPLELRLEPGLVVVGRVEDSNGQPLTNASVQVFLWSGNMGTQFEPKAVPADQQGRFEVSGLPVDRRFSFSANAKGYGSASQTVEREDSATNRVELPALVLKRADRQLAGQVVDADDKPVAGARVYMFGSGQPNTSVRSDRQGRFKFEAVVEGTIQLYTSARGANANTSAQAGASDVVVRLGEQQTRVYREVAPQRTALKGQLLPDLAPVHLAGDVCPADKPVLLCLFDLEQRPSRRVLHGLAEQAEALKQKGVTVLALQATVTTAEAFKEWKDASPLPFPVGYVSEKSDKTRWAAGVETLPWLILADKQHRVIAEGFSLEELEAQLKALSK